MRGLQNRLCKPEPVRRIEVVVAEINEVEEDQEEAEVEIQMAPLLKIILMLAVAMSREKIQTLEEAINIEGEVVKRILIKEG